MVLSIGLYVALGSYQDVYSYEESDSASSTKDSSDFVKEVSGEVMKNEISTAAKNIRRNNFWSFPLNGLAIGLGGCVPVVTGIGYSSSDNAKNTYLLAATILSACASTLLAFSNYCQSEKESGLKTIEHYVENP